MLGESGAFGADADLPGPILLDVQPKIGPSALSCSVF